LAEEEGKGVEMEEGKLTRLCGQQQLQGEWDIPEIPQNWLGQGEGIIKEFGGELGRGNEWQ
jgi:hypothetical protein